MCGITGIYSFNDGINEKHKKQLQDALSTLNKRGPDDSGIFSHSNVLLGHSRLAIIDVSKSSAQPFTDQTGRFTIVFNGAIYNYKELQNFLKQKGYSFKSGSDTEVLLYMFIEKKEECLNDLNGFFSFVIYDKQEESLFIARDRFGIKPLYYYADNECFAFASEMKALLKYNINSDIERSSLRMYLQLNYIPGPWTIFENVRKLLPGHYLHINSDKKIKEGQYYSLAKQWDMDNQSTSYEKSCQKLHDLMESSVLDRLVCDVPIGSFLSGGIDSSIVTGLASKHINKLNTFSIGFKDEPMFDETTYAEAVAKKHNTNHTVFNLTNDDLFDCLFDVLNYIDEPFADSSALAVYILSKKTGEKVKVALSGDGADELFAGYNKHSAEFRALNPGIKEKLALSLYPLINKLPQSRDTQFSNKIRQIVRFANGYKLPSSERYWKWCSINGEEDVSKLLLNKKIPEDYLKNKDKLLEAFNDKQHTIDHTLYSDIKMILPYDMLTKVDLMSMANSLEVRTPFLDYRLVDFIQTLPYNYKINKNNKKIILKDTFSYLLPEEIINRPKHGFEVPLLKWMRNEIYSLIHDELLEDNFIIEQGIFDPKEITYLKNKLSSNNPGDSASKVWNIIVFQKWWNNFLNNR